MGAFACERGGRTDIQRAGRANQSPAASGPSAASLYACSGRFTDGAAPGLCHQSCQAVSGNPVESKARRTLLCHRPHHRGWFRRGVIEHPHPP